MHFSHVNGFPQWLSFQISALRGSEKLNAFSKAEQAPKCVPIPPVSSLFWIRRLESQGICWFFFFLLNTFPLAWLVFNFVVGSSFLQGKAVLWGRRCPLSSSPLFLHTKDVEKCGIFGPCLCGRFLKKKSCGALEDGSLRVWIILRIIFYTKKFAFLEPNEVFFLIFTRTPEKW